MNIQHSPAADLTSSTPRILLVEDDKNDIAITTHKLLRCAPLATLDVVKTIEQAIAKLLAGRYHCVLLDLNLPDSLGPRSIVDIRSKDRLTPIIVLTGFAPPLTVKESLKAGAKLVLSKSEITDATLSEALSPYCL